MQTSPDLPTTVDFGNNLVNYIEVSPEDALPPHKSASRAGSEAEGASRSGSHAKDQPRPPRYKAVDPPASYRSEIPQYLVDFDQPEDSGAYRSAVAAIEKLPTPPSLPGFLGKPILNAATLMKDDNSVLNMPNHTVLNHLATSSIKNNVLAVSATTRYRNKVSTCACACACVAADAVRSMLRQSCTSRRRQTRAEVSLGPGRRGGRAEASLGPGTEGRPCCNPQPTRIPSSSFPSSSPSSSFSSSPPPLPLFPPPLPLIPLFLPPPSSPGLVDDNSDSFGDISCCTCLPRLVRLGLHRAS